MLFTLFKLDMNIEYKGYTFIYIIYKYWPISIFYVTFSRIHIFSNEIKREAKTEV